MPPIIHIRYIKLESQINMFNIATNVTINSSLLMPVRDTYIYAHLYQIDAVF